MQRATIATAIALSLGLAAPARAGPPFLTDDPEPTDTGHWEIYAPLLELEGRGADLGGAASVEVNYGAAPDVQLSLAAPLAMAHDAGGWTFGSGDIELSAKYRFYHDEKRGLSVAAFPGITIPTASRGLGAGKVTAFLPVWAQQDWGSWSLFGGAGYAIDPGAGGRNHWEGGIALANQVGKRLLLGLEAKRRGADVPGGTGETSLGLGIVYDLAPPFRLIASGGPSFDDGDPSAGFHALVGLGLNY